MGISTRAPEHVGLLQTDVLNDPLRSDLGREVPGLPPQVRHVEGKGAVTVVTVRSVDFPFVTQYAFLCRCRPSDFGRRLFPPASHSVIRLRTQR